MRGGNCHGILVKKQRRKIVDFWVSDQVICSLPYESLCATAN